MNFTIDEILFCASECEKQKSGEMSVYNMACGLQLAKLQNLPTLDFIISLGKTIEPTKNFNGLRKIPITINGIVSGVSPQNILSSLQNLVSALLTFGSISAKEAYQEFEKIHPFIDGNGRVGAILFNFLNGTINNPQNPPTFKN